MSGIKGMKKYPQGIREKILVEYKSGISQRSLGHYSFRHISYKSAVTELLRVHYLVREACKEFRNLCLEIIRIADFSLKKHIEYLFKIFLIAGRGNPPG